MTSKKDREEADFLAEALKQTVLEQEQEKIHKLTQELRESLVGVILPVLDDAKFHPGTTQEGAGLTALYVLASIGIDAARTQRASNVNIAAALRRLADIAATEADAAEPSSGGEHGTAPEDLPS